MHKFIDQDEFIIVILDSCRYDYFQHEINSHLPGKLEKVYTPATATINYVQTIWDGQYDLTYITGIPAPTNYAFERKGLKYRPEEHFSDFVHVWQTCEKKRIGSGTARGNDGSRSQKSSRPEGCSLCPTPRAIHW